MKLLDVLADKDDVIKGNGVSEEEVRKAEEELKVTFAPDYREYLLSAGLLMCNGHELTGIGNSERTNVVAVTKQMQALWEGIPENWYVIENENMDGAAMWQDPQGNVYFNKKKEFSSFTEFLSSL